MERTKCIWCDCDRVISMFENTRMIPAASYTTAEYERGVWIPYNVQRCSECKAYQIQHLGDPNVVYGKNHAYSHGKTLRDMCSQFKAFVLRESSTLYDVLEIGAGNGYLADLLAPVSDSYTIVDPAYFGNRENRTIIPEFIENYSKTHSTVIMSHVFEHFYNPREVLDIIRNADDIFLNFPDLESYTQHQTFHVLNPEHTFFVENDFLVQVFRNYGFTLQTQQFFRGHSVFFHFKRSSEPLPQMSLRSNNSDALILGYFNDVWKAVDNINSMQMCYLWPCSMHSQFLLAMGADPSKIAALFDNCEAKHGTYMYGFNLQCLPYSSNVGPIVLNGGCFNPEVSNSGP